MNEQLKEIKRLHNVCRAHREEKQELLEALKAIVNGLPEEYDDKHTRELLERAGRAITNATK